MLLSALLALILISSGAPAVMAQSNTTASEPAQYSIEELSDGGSTTAGAPTSMRFLGEYGSATIRHEPVGLGSSEWQYVGADTQVEKNEVSIKTIRLGNPDEELDIHVVTWNRGHRVTEREDGSTTREPVARNVSERVVSVRLSEGYDNATIPLPSSFDSSQRVTMWVEEYPNQARWTFSHRSVATSKPISIDSWGDFLNALFMRIGIIALPAMLLGGGLAKRHQQRAIVGPQWGLAKWGAVIAIPIALFASVFAFQGAVIATRIPQAIGALFAPVAYALVLEGADPELERFLFRRQDLENATSPRGDNTHDSRFVDHISKKGLHRAADEELLIVSPGIIPYLARLWGRKATLDISEIETHKRGKHSPYTLEIELDPSEALDEALIHEPPQLERKELTERIDIGETELTVPTLAIALPAVILIAGGWFGLKTTLGIPMVGAMIGGLATLPFIYTVNNGGAHSKPAPYHFTQAEASLAFETERYADAQTVEQYRDVAWSERMKTPLDALDAADAFDDNSARELSSRIIGDKWLEDVHQAADPKPHGDDDD